MFAFLVWFGCHAWNARDDKDVPRLTSPAVRQTHGGRLAAIVPLFVGGRAGRPGARSMWTYRSREFLHDLAQIDLNRILIVSVIKKPKY